MAPATTKNQQCEKEEIPHGDLFQTHNEVIYCNSGASSDRRIDKIINRSEAIVASQFQALPGDVRAMCSTRKSIKHVSEMLQSATI